MIYRKTFTKLYGNTKHNCTNNAQWNYVLKNFVLAMESWKWRPRSHILRPEVDHTGDNNVCKQWCDHIIALNSFRSAFSQSSSTEGTVSVKVHFLALQNTALILLISSAVIIPENAGQWPHPPRHWKRPPPRPPPLPTPPTSFFPSPARATPPPQRNLSKII